MERKVVLTSRIDVSCNLSSRRAGEQKGRFGSGESGR